MPLDNKLVTRRGPGSWELEGNLGQHEERPGPWVAFGALLGAIELLLRSEVLDAHVCSRCLGQATVGATGGD